LSNRCFVSFWASVDSAGGLAEWRLETESKNEFPFVELSTGGVPTTEATVLVSTLEIWLEVRSVVGVEVIEHNGDLNRDRNVEIVVVNVLEPVSIWIAVRIEHEVDGSEQ
jgi:hypothetical protein